MKKSEAKLLAPENSKILIGYITQILSSEENAKINISYAKIEKENVCTFDIYVPSQNFERHFNTGITLQQSDALNEQILNDLLDNFMDSETIGATTFYSIKSSGGQFNGVKCMNIQGNTIPINFIAQGNNFDKLVKAYNQRIKDRKSELEKSSEENLDRKMI